MSWHESNIEEIGPQSPLRVTLREGVAVDQKFQEIKCTLDGQNNMQTYLDLAVGSMD
jgi:hypothetical protein